jgi:hypothetical protein
MIPYRDREVSRRSRAGGELSGVCEIVEALLLTLGRASGGGDEPTEESPLIKVDVRVGLPDENVSSFRRVRSTGSLAENADKSGRLNVRPLPLTEPVLLGPAEWGYAEKSGSSGVPAGISICVGRGRSDRGIGIGVAMGRDGASPPGGGDGIDICDVFVAGGK